MSLKRLNKELAYLVENGTPDGWEIAPDSNEDLYTWKGSLKGPSGSLYEGGVFSFIMKFPQDYPFKPPKVRFTTKIYHCNILYENADSPFGLVYCSILHSRWSPAKSIEKAIEEIIKVLREPELDPPGDLNITLMFERNRAEYNRIAMEWTREYAMPAEAQPVEEVKNSESAVIQPNQ